MGEPIAFRDASATLAPIGLSQKIGKLFSIAGASKSK